MGGAHSSNRRSRSAASSDNDFIIREDGPLPTLETNPNQPQERALYLVLRQGANSGVRFAVADTHFDMHFAHAEGSLTKFRCCCCRLSVCLPLLHTTEQV